MAGYTPAASAALAGYAETSVNLWPAWNTQYITNVYGTSANTNVWQGWIQQTPLTYGTTSVADDQTLLVTETIWYQWNTQFLGGQVIYQPVPIPVTMAQQPVETAEQRIAREERELVQKREYEMLVAKKAAAKVRARQTLTSTLSRRQQEEFERDGTFELLVNDRLYRVRPGCRVERLDPKSKAIKSYFCIHPANAHDLPGEDWAISQKLLLEANEAEFLRLANETRVA